MAFKKILKNHYVVNGHNLVWPTYAVTLGARQNKNQNTMARGTTAIEFNSICGPIYVTLFVAKEESELF